VFWLFLGISNFYYLVDFLLGKKQKLRLQRALVLEI